jgi:5-methylthioadenosine/S-adenosylhomocysteine deaminase
MNENTHVISANWLVTATQSGVKTHANAAIQIDAQGAIVALGETNSLIAALDASSASYEHTKLGASILAPGLINAHTHAAMALLRGAADDLPLMDWLQKRIWPMEGALVDPTFVKIGTQLAAAEMLLGGTTTCADMYFYPEDAARAFMTMGMRAQLAMPVINFPTRYAADADRYLSLALAARDALKSEALLSFALGPHAPYTVDDDTFKRIASYAAEIGLPVHTHLQETASEVDDALKQTGERPTARLERLGLLGPDFVGAHGVHLNALDIARLAKNSANIVHCPSSNLKLASGIAPITALLKAGVNVAIGTDGAASNNRLDMFEEMRLAALLAKVQANDASAVNASQAFHAATLGGANALGLSNITGSLEVGKAADIIAISCNSVGVQPMFDPVSHLVYAASRADVSYVWVHGRARVRDGALVAEAQQAIDDSQSTIREISERVAAMR